MQGPTTSSSSREMQSLSYLQQQPMDSGPNNRSKLIISAGQTKSLLIDLCPIAQMRYLGTCPSSSENTEPTESQLSTAREQQLLPNKAPRTRFQGSQSQVDSLGQIHLLLGQEQMRINKARPLRRYPRESHSRLQPQVSSRPQQ